MYLKRVTVEEGFLHGLDLALAEGLTVLVGARGSGKTSIIELIRFALGVSDFGDDQLRAAERQATAVLGSGRVSVTLDVAGSEVTYTRSADDASPRCSDPISFPPPIILSQNEIERVGRHPDSRLQLLDGFVPTLGDNESAEGASTALISSLSVELHGLEAQLRSTEEEIARLASVPLDLANARVEAAAATNDLEQTADHRARLEQLSAQMSTGGVAVESLERAEGAIRARLEAAHAAAIPIRLEPWPASSNTEDPLVSIRAALEQATADLAAASARISDAATEVARLRAVMSGTLVQQGDEARTLRSYLDELSEGAGAKHKRVADLESLDQRRQALLEYADNLRSATSDVRQRRDLELDRLDQIRDSRVNLREEAATALNVRIGPRVKVVVDRYGSTDRYADLLADILRGSGVQQNVLAPVLAKAVSPRELVHIAEASDAPTLARLAGIAIDRAQRVVNHLREVGTAGLLAASAEDTVQFSLLDGNRYKPAEELSVGQRCTVVLPIILNHTERVLIVDQPEDNLDNSFVAETLVQSLKNRPAQAQMIFATHNANIPVLGEADRVVVMVSDGKRGEIAHAGQLDDPESVVSITNIMEGGIEAFEARASFYGHELQ